MAEQAVYVLVGAVSVLALCLLAATLVAFTVFGRFTISHFGHNLRFLPCKYCSGGTQWWDGRNWGPIPKHVDVLQHKEKVFFPKQANTRSCQNCQLGGHWTDRTDKEEQ